MYEFKFADIGEGIHEGVIHQWLVKEGDTVKDGQTMFLVETDKVTAEMPSPVDGRVHKINFQVGQTIHVGDVVIVLDDGSSQEVREVVKEVVKEVVEERGSTSVVGEIEISSNVIPSSEESHGVSDVKLQHKVLATPVARKMAKDLGVDIASLAGSGPNGRIMKDDIQKSYDKRNQKLVNEMPIVGKTTVENEKSDTGKRDTGKYDSDVERIPMTMLRKTIAKNMVLSKFTIPHTAAMDEVNVTELVNYRKRINDLVAADGDRFTFMPLIIKAIAIALRQHPILNASVDMDRDEIVLKKSINIGVATDTPDGLMVPVIKNANVKSLIELSREIAQLGHAAKHKTLTLKDLEGGTFTITNYGSIGALYGVPVIKSPEVAIIGIGTIYKKPAVAEDGSIVVQDTLPLSISFDHRIVDGADAGRFLQTIKRLLSNPDLLLLN